MSYPGYCDFVVQVLSTYLAFPNLGTTGDGTPSPYITWQQDKIIATYDPYSGNYNTDPKPPDDGGEGEGECFLEGTLVTLSSKEHVEIQNLEVGQELLSFRADHAKEVGKIIEIHSSTVSSYLKITTSSDRVLRVTEKHPVYQYKCCGKDSFVLAEELIEGSLLSTLGGNANLNQETVVEIKRIDKKVKVFNLSTESKRYFANGVAVHNKGGGGDGGDDACPECSQGDLTPSITMVVPKAIVAVGARYVFRWAYSPDLSGPGANSVEGTETTHTITVSASPPGDILYWQATVKVGGDTKESRVFAVRICPSPHAVDEDNGDANINKACCKDADVKMVITGPDTVTGPTSEFYYVKIDWQCMKDQMPGTEQNTFDYDSGSWSVTDPATVTQPAPAQVAGAGDPDQTPTDLKTIVRFPCTADNVDVEQELDGEPIVNYEVEVWFTATFIHNGSGTKFQCTESKTVSAECATANTKPYLSITPSHLLTLSLFNSLPSGNTKKIVILTSLGPTLMSIQTC